MKHKRIVKPKKSDIIVPDIFEDEDDEEEGLDVFEGDNLVVSKKTKRVLRDVQDDWVRSYIIN